MLLAKERAKLSQYHRNNLNPLYTLSLFILKIKHSSAYSLLSNNTDFLIKHSVLPHICVDQHELHVNSFILKSLFINAIWSHPASVGWWVGSWGKCRNAVLLSITQPFPAQRTIHHTAGYHEASSCFNILNMKYFLRLKGACQYGKTSLCLTPQF